MTPLSSSGGRDPHRRQSRGEPFKGLAIERIDGKIDAEAFLLGAIHELLAEGHADVDIGKRFAVANDRRHAENREASRPGSTPTMDLPVLIASTTVERLAEASSPNTFGAWTR